MASQVVRCGAGTRLVLLYISIYRNSRSTSLALEAALPLQALRSLGVALPLQAAGKRKRNPTKVETTCQKQVVYNLRTVDRGVQGV